MGSLFADVTFSTEALAVISALLGALVTAIVVLFRSLIEVQAERISYLERITQQQSHQMGRHGIPLRRADDVGGDESAAS